MAHRYIGIEIRQGALLPRTVLGDDPDEVMGELERQAGRVLGTDHPDLRLILLDAEIGRVTATWEPSSRDWDIPSAGAEVVVVAPGSVRHLFPS